MSDKNEISREDWEKLAKDLENMTPISLTFNADEKIKPEFLTNYQSAAKIFWWELIALLEILEVAKQMDEFDFESFSPKTDYDNEYLSIISRQSWLNLRNAVLIITRLTTGNDDYTLFKFEKDVNQWIKDEHKDDLNRKLDELASQNICECRIKKDTENLKKLRDKCLAHIDKQVAYGNFEHPKIELSELKTVYEKLIKFLEALMFENALTSYNTQSSSNLRKRLDAIKSINTK